MNYEKIKNIAAIGAGAMGAGTSLCYAMAGYNVQLYDLTEAKIEFGLQNLRAALNSFVDHNLVQGVDAPEILRRVTTTTSLEKATSNADLVIESVVEDLNVKQGIFKKLDALCPEHTLFTSNTSGLSPTAIAEVLSKMRQQKFVVTHFWNPPQLIPLVEVVPGRQTTQNTVDLACAIMTKIGKKPVPLKRECLGFVGNRLQAALLREALSIVEAGIATADDVDAVTEYSLGRRLSETGPLKSADLGGLDVFAYIFGYLGSDLNRDAGVPHILQQAVDAGRLGAKTGQGLYSWQADTLAELKQKREQMLFEHLQRDRDQSESKSLSNQRQKIAKA